MTKQEIMEREGHPPADAGGMNPVQMLSYAVEQGRDVAVIEKLMDLQERWEKTQARKAYDNAIAAAKAQIPIISKNQWVGFENRQGGETNYRHEDLAEISRIVTPILAKHGLSYRFRTGKSESGDVEVTCIISHRDGYAEENTLSAPPDTSGKKNAIQSVGSTITYLQRYTLKAALGLAAGNDDDARSSEGDVGIDEERVGFILKLIDKYTADTEKVCKRFGVQSIPELRQSQYQDVVDSLNEFGRQQREQK